MISVMSLSPNTVSPRDFLDYLKCMEHSHTIAPEKRTQDYKFIGVSYAVNAVLLEDEMRQRYSSVFGKMFALDPGIFPHDHFAKQNEFVVFEGPLVYCRDLT